MLKFVPSYFSHQDERGSLKGLINSGEWKEMNMISSIKDTIRGNHFHKETTELFIILDGLIEVTCQDISAHELSKEIQKIEVKVGDVFLIEPNTLHTFKMLEDSRWINALSEAMDSSHPDLHRL